MIVDIFYPETPSQNDLSKPLHNSSDMFSQLNLDKISSDIILGSFQVNLGSLPSKSGEGETYKKNIKDQVRTYLEKRPLLQPLMTSLKLTVLVKKESSSKKDLDNIAKEIIEAIGDMLKPPTNHTNSLQDDEINFLSGSCTYANDFTKKNKNYLNFGFIGYQVLYKPKAPNDDEEFVRLNIHNNNFEDFADYINRRYYKISKYGQFN